MLSPKADNLSNWAIGRSAFDEERLKNWIANASPQEVATTIAEAIASRDATVDGVELGCFILDAYGVDFDVLPDDDEN